MWIECLAQGLDYFLSVLGVRRKFSQLEKAKVKTEELVLCSVEFDSNSWTSQFSESHPTSGWRWSRPIDSIA